MNSKTGSDSCDSAKISVAQSLSDKELADLASQIKQWGQELGFQQLGISDTRLDDHETRLQEWLDKKFHGSMSYMERHGTRRSRPEQLIAGTVRVISARMNYLS